MWINKKNKKENVNKVSCWILAVIFAVVVFGSAGLAAADEEESKEIPVLRIDGNVYDESGANRWYTEEPKVEVCLDGAAKISDKEIRDEEMQGEKIPDKEMQDEEIPDQEIYCNMQYEITYTSGEKKAETVNFTEQEEEGNWRYSFEPAVWKEGKNQLRLWQESETGETEWEQKAVICIDKTVPAAVVFSYPAGSEERGYCYQTETEMLVKSQDESSGVEKIIVQQEDGTKLELEGAEGSVYLPLGYQGRLEAYAVDYAGLESVRSSSEQIICEDEKPLIAVMGAGKSGEWQKDLPKIRLWIGERSEKYTCSAGLRLAVCYVNGEEINRKYYENPTESDSFTVKLEKADYQEKVDKSLKSFRQKAQIPGFRKGMVPMSLVKKMYGKSALAEEVNKLLSETVYKYIQDNKVNILGEPLPNEDKQQEIDFDTMEEFEFLFDIALAPEFKAEVSAKDKVDYYTIEVTDEMVDNQVKAYTQRNGKYDKVDVYEDNDMLKGLLAELDEEGNTKEGGIQVEGAVMMPSYMKNDEQKAIFAGAKVNDVLVFNPNTAWDGNAAELSSLLKIDKEAAPEVKSNFSFQVEEITRFVPGDLTQEIFDQVFGEGNVKTEEEFRAKVKEVIANQFVADSDYKFLIDARKMLTEKVGKLEFPDALLKRIMRLNNPDKEESFVEDNYDKSIEELTWHLIKEQLVKANDIKVEQEDITNMAKEATRAQFAQYGMMSVPEEILENYSKEMLKKKESIEGLVNRVVESKLATALKSQVELEHKNVSAEEFNKMFA